MTEPETKGGEANGGENPKVSAVPGKKGGETRSITSYDVFEQCIARAENLIAVRDSTETVEEISDEHYCDCYRAAIVLTISALDAFVRKVVVSEIRRLLADEKTQLSPELSEYIKNLLSRDKLLDAARKYNILEMVESAVKSDFETKSFQGEWKIISFMKMVGYKDIFAEVALKADINEKNLKRKLNVFTNRRHVIAHSGDYDLNQSPHKENDISEDYARECIRTVRLFARTMHEIVDSS